MSVGQHSRGAEGPSPARLHAAVAGYASLDRIYRVHHLPAPGTTGIVSRTSEGPYWGGCAFNVAVGMARMGLRVGVIGAVGEDSGGERYGEWLRSNGIDTTALAVSPGVGTPASSLYYDEEGTSICYFWPGAAGYTGVPEPQRELLSRAEWLVLTVAPADLTARLLDEAEKLHMPVAWSVKADVLAYPQSLVERLLSTSRLIFLNQAELRFIHAATGRDTPAAILDAGPEVVVLTLGAEGSMVAIRQGTARVPAAHAHSVVDPTGSGDAYVSGFLAAYLRGLDPAQAAPVGSVNAAAVIEQVGSQTGLCTWEEQIWRQTHA